jgi:EAL domain-containing protein (putative c-di-GMP-specific phosphodiesterase class I)
MTELLAADTEEVPPHLADPLSAALAARDRETLAELRAALRARRAFLAYQPVMQAARPDRPAFWEGLIRICDATGRVIPARDFIGVAETCELGRKVDTLALEIGLEALAAHPGLRLSVNLSARSIGYPAWKQALDRGLSAGPTVAERLILEITESSAMLMPDLVTVFMRDLQRRGIAFALDDFGAGFTSFRYLRDFTFDIVKIDGQFIRGIHADPDNQVLTQALLSVARHFDMFTVAESVEDPRDAAWLTAAGIDCLQGYLYGAPNRTPVWAQETARRRA